MKTRARSLKLLAAAACLVGGAWGLEAATYSNITTNMGTYLLRAQTDTWTGCMLTLTNGMIVESNAVVGLVSSTNTCYLPVNASYLQSNFIGRRGTGRLWAINSRINVISSFDVGGADGTGSMHLTNTTFVAYRDPSTGIIPMRVGQNGGSNARTSVVELVNSTMTFNFSNGRNVSLMIGPSGFGRLTLDKSSIGTTAVCLGMLSSGGAFLAPDQVVASFNASTVTAWRVRVGGDPQFAYSNGKYTFSNGSLLRLPAGWDPGWAQGPGGLLVGYWGTTGYTSTVTVASASRVESAYPTLVGYQPDRGNGRLTFTDGSVGRLNNDVILGFEPRSRGFLDVFSDSQVYVTNALETASLVVGKAGRGMLSIDGGTCKADKLYVTNGVNSVLAFSAGRLSVKTGLIANNTALTIGNGISSATFEQWGGGATVVQGAMRFKANSQWSVAVDASTDKVLDVTGELSFDPGATLALTTASDYAALDGRVLALANTASTRPEVLADGELKIMIETAAGGRKALVLRSVTLGAVLMIR